MLDEQGREITDPRPTVIELDGHETGDERIRRIIDETMRRHAYENGMESMEEADDFDCDEPFDVEFDRSDYEQMDDDYPPNYLDPNEGPDLEAQGIGDNPPGPNDGKEGESPQNDNEPPETTE